jgi:hypothetical protein
MPPVADAVEYSKASNDRRIGIQRPEDIKAMSLIEISRCVLERRLHELGRIPALVTAEQVLNRPPSSAIVEHTQAPPRSRRSVAAAASR